MIDKKAGRKDLPQELTEILTKEGISRPTDIQQKAYPFLFSDENLVIVAPSGSGKTLIAELIALKDILQTRNKISSPELSFIDLLSKDRQANATPDVVAASAKTVFLVPLRALAEEKANHLAKIYRQLQIKIHKSMSEIDFNPDEIINCHILVSTFERFRTIVGRMPNLLSSIKNVVIDEFHLIGDQHRGPVVETILTAIREKARLILLSATIANPADVANWLNAQLIHSEERLIPLDFEIITSIHPEKEIKRIIANTVPYNAQVLIFCGTRKRAEELAEEYANFILLKSKQSGSFNPGEVLSFLESIPLPQDSIGNAKLYNLVQKGTAFHHAGLSRIAQNAIGELFKGNRIRVLFCTETLGAGVNLPAREVIILNAKRHNNEWLSRNVFHQIAGRAGRPGYDFRGKCTVIATDRREEQAIRKRYWFSRDNNDEKDKNSVRQGIFGLDKPRFDAIDSKIRTREELEKMVLSLIYARRPTFDELISLLRRSYLDFASQPLAFMPNTAATVHRTNTSFDYAYLRKDWSEIYFRTLLELTTHLNREQLDALMRLYPLEGLEITKKFDGKRIQSFKVKEGKFEFTVSLSNGLLSCSCAPGSIFCKHKMLILQQLSEENVKEIINTNFSILHKLRVKNFIAENARGQLRTTTKGAICAEMGVSIKKFEYLMNWLMYHLFEMKPTLRQLLYECIEVTQQAAEDNGEIPIDSSFKRPIYEHVIVGEDIIEVVIRHNIYEGDLIRLETRIKSLVTGLIPLAEFLGLTRISKSLTNLDSLLTEVIKLSL